MITISNIHKHFEDQEVLHGISATFEAGKTNLTIGRSGSGKTVLLRCIVGRLEPTQGQILYDGRDIHKLSKREGTQLRQEMGMLFQGAALFDSMDVLHNVLFPLEMFSSKTYNEQLRRARFCLDRVGLTGSENKMPAELSGGMQKRVAIARAIALEPRYLFCDEPNSGLDPYRRGSSTASSVTSPTSMASPLLSTPMIWVRCVVSENRCSLSTMAAPNGLVQAIP